jgi:hypothetical protein
MSILPAALFDFDFFEPLPIQIEVSDAPLTSDAGLFMSEPCRIPWLQLQVTNYFNIFHYSFVNCFLWQSFLIKHILKFDIY